MALTPIRIPDLQARDPIVDAERRPVSSFIRALNKAFQTIATATNDQGDIIAQLAALTGLVLDQQAMIEDLQTAQENSDTESSIQNSGVVNEAAQMTASLSGNVTVPNHDRVYGNSTLNPTVAVTGAVVGTGAAAGDVIYIYYDQPSRAGGVVTYQFTLDNATAVQTGDRHSVGNIEIPSVGSSTGTFTRPRGV